MILTVFAQQKALPALAGVHCIGLEVKVCDRLYTSSSFPRWLQQAGLRSQGV